MQETSKLNSENQKMKKKSFIETNLIGVDDDLALLLVAARDEEEVVERGCVVQDAVVLKRVLLTTSNVLKS